MMKRLFVWMFLMSMMQWPDIQRHVAYAGDTKYYDHNGNMISRETYEKLVENLIPKGNKETEIIKQSGSLLSIQEAEEAAAKKRREEMDQPPEPDEENDNNDLDLPFQIEISSETLLSSLSRITGDNRDVLIAPLYQYIRLDMGTLDQEGFSFHMYGWGRNDFKDSDFFESNPDGELLYGYIEYSEPNYSFNLKAGRQHVMAGVLNDIIDGIGVQSALSPYVHISVYGGFPVDLSSENGQSGIGFFGGRVAVRKTPDYEIGFSYKKITSDSKNEEIAGFDFSAAGPFNTSLLGSSSYNLDSRGWGEHLYEIRFEIGDFYFQPSFQQCQYEDYFNVEDQDASLFRNLAQIGDRFSAVGSDVYWQHFRAVDLGFKAYYYNYDQHNSAIYLEGNAIWHISDLSQIGGQISRLKGDTSDQRYLLARSFFYLTMTGGLIRPGFFSGDIMYVSYDESIYERDFSLWISLGTGWSYLEDTLQVKLSADWRNDPYFDSDLRGLLKISYVF